MRFNYGSGPIRDLVLESKVVAVFVRFVSLPALILLLYAYPKNVTADLSPKQVAQLAKVVREEFGDETANV